MANTALITALAKTLIAIAWADGELHREEETTLKEVLGLLPPMPAKEWAVIELYLAVPVGAEERGDLIAHTCARIRSRADKELALEAVDNMLHADGVVRPGEEAAAQEARTAFDAVDVSPIAVLGRVIGSGLQRRPDREAGLDLWRSNPIAYYLSVQPDGAEDGADRPDVAVAALAAGIMAQVVRVTATSAELERPVLVEALLTDWNLPPDLAERVATAALEITRRDVDYHRLSRELLPRTTEEQRVRLLNTLFAIANAADRVAPEEIDAIRVISGRLQLTGQQFVAAKLKIAPEDRGRL